MIWMTGMTRRIKITEMNWVEQEDWGDTDGWDDKVTRMIEMT